ncbi:MAG: hypothetical protein JWM98_2232, partial [Thermoleophilia bacterium]|nr:hypothetical protein [Thermoleophilia bacterium]
TTPATAPPANGPGSAVPDLGGVTAGVGRAQDIAAQANAQAAATDAAGSVDPATGAPAG